MFSPDMIAIKSSSLLHNKSERDNLDAVARHFAEIIQNDGVGHFFDESDAVFLCESMVVLVDALNVAALRPRRE